ncbi:50S ribosomal protein L13 [Acidobacteria bacterium Mor1]|nr:50S ribosomal protein L13 [Acidobacteria bacterium Mor1]
MKTYVPKQGEIDRAWWVVDASGMTLGRLSTVVASHLRGKHKPSYTPFLDTGDHVIVLNADKVVLTGRKWEGKHYYAHTGWPGGIKEIRADKLRDRRPERLVEFAVWGMLPKGPLGRKMFRKLKVYAGDQHPHVAQQPKELAIAGAIRQEKN